MAVSGIFGEYIIFLKSNLFTDNRRCCITFFVQQCHYRIIVGNAHLNIWMDQLCINTHDYSPDYPGTSVFEIASYGIPLSKIVVGKYTNTADAFNGFMTPAVLSQCFGNATQTSGWKACNQITLTQHTTCYICICVH